MTTRKQATRKHNSYVSPEYGTTGSPANSACRPCNSLHCCCFFIVKFKFSCLTVSSLAFLLSLILSCLVWSGLFLSVMSCHVMSCHVLSCMGCGWRGVVAGTKDKIRKADMDLAQLKANATSGSGRGLGRPIPAQQRR